MKEFLVGVALMIVGPLLRKASPVIREKVHGLVLDVQEAASKTNNKFDDHLADFLHDVIFGDDDDDLDDK